MKDEFSKEGFAARLEDMCGLAAKRRKPVYSLFLNEREQYEANAYLGRRSGINTVLWGGDEACTRKMLRVCDEDCYVQDDRSDFPIYALTLTFRKADKPGHRDFLGSFMALGIKRETVGDIFVGEGAAVVFCSKTAHDLIADGIATVGRTGVSVTEGVTGDAAGYITPARFETIQVNIASERADCIVSGITGLSREKSAALIRSGGFILNYSECDNISRDLSGGDVVTLRGYGKYIVCEDIQTTKKGRLKIELKKYI